MSNNVGPGTAAGAEDAAPASSSVQSVDRAITVLSLLASAGELGVTQIAEALEVHKSTAFRLLATLEKRALVEQNVERGKYRLGVGIIQLAGATSARLDVVRESRPVSHQLAQALGETVNIAVLSGPDALYVDQVNGAGALQIQNWLGQRIPLHATSNGKVLLAALSSEHVDRLLAGGLQRFTERTCVDLAALHEELDQVRRRGYAKAVDELEVGLTAVAAPLHRADGAVVASISASGPTFRIGPDRLPLIIEQVTASADRASRRLGWHGLPAVAGGSPPGGRLEN
jgi:DNA-binding IclR family transcriptional regulator